jgi:hypothetical protein
MTLKGSNMTHRKMTCARAVDNIPATRAAMPENRRLVKVWLPRAQSWSGRVLVVRPLPFNPKPRISNVTRVTVCTGSAR